MVVSKSNGEPNGSQLMVILCMAAAMREPSHLPMHADQIATQADGAAMKIGFWEPGM
jgi:hypothetical protein